MKRILLAAALCAALATPAFGGLWRIVSADRSSVTVELNIPEPTIVPIDAEGQERMSRISVSGFFPFDVEGSPILPVRRLFFAVPAKDGVRLDVLEEDSYFMSGVLPSVSLGKGSRADERKALEKAPSLSEQRFVRLSGIERLRGTWCAFVDVRPVLFDPAGPRLSCARRLVVRLSFPSTEKLEGAAEGSLFGSDLVVNAEQAASWKRAPEKAAPIERTPFEFARSSSWVKIGVRERGIYSITYNDLLAAGADPGSIDPATVRLFSGGPLAEPDSISQGGSFLDEYHLTEHAIIFRGGGVGAFQPGDTLLFYGLPIDGWGNDIEPSEDARMYVEHPYDTMNVYWLTWGGSFGEAPRRMTERGVAPSGSPDTVITWYEERIRRERDLNYDPIFTDDRWYWSFLKMNGSTSSFSDDFYTSSIADAAGVMKTMAYGPYNSSRYQETATYRINGTVVGTLDWIVPYGYNPAGMKTLVAPVSNILEGKNTFTVSKPVDNEMYVLWYEMFYHRRLVASQGVLDYHVPVRPMRASYALSGFPAGEKLLFDVTYDESPVLLTGWQPAAGGLAFEDSLHQRARHYAAVSRGAFKKAALSVASVSSLRDEAFCPEMVIIYHKNFRNAALILKSHRDRTLAVRAVDVDDVYDNFSGGHKDPIAIRNYLKFLYDKGSCASGGEPVLKYVLLIGNGTYDPRNLLKQGNDFIPLYISITFPNESEGIEDEDFLVKLDDGDHAPDLAIGRMSVLTDREANAWAQRIIDYEDHPENGPWKGKVILCADDEFSTSRTDDFEFQVASEELASAAGPFPTALDIKKIYLHLYPFDGDVKPAARNDLIREWSDGAIIVNFDGHGSPLQMADERLMVNSDIYSLTNGERRPLYLSFSCSVGDLESPYHRSMAQNMVTYDGGGAIATISAAAPTYLYPNELLNQSILTSLFMSKDSTGTRPLGYALQLAKYSIASHEGYESNNVKYILLGDPAMRLAVPAYKVVHETSAIDTMRTGNRYQLTGSVTSAGQVLSSFNGTADVIVQESAQKTSEFIKSAGVTLDYFWTGKELFRGTVDVVGGRFSVEYVVPHRCRTGPDARIRTYVSSPPIDGVGACDTLRIMRADTLRSDLEPPAVHLYFAGQATKVKAGAMLIADVSDPDGIAILGTDPQSSISLEFDGSGYPIYVTDYFTYDHGSYTTGKVEYPLPAGFETGRHTVFIKAFDNLGLASADTLRFEIVEEGLYEVSDVFNLPNPFSKSTNFIFQVTNPAEARLSVFTVSGIKIWERRIAAEEGFNSMYWDGRDLAGDRIANGTYLYVLEVNFKDSFHRTETVRGRAVLLK
jgi:hypothetical protein